jgi:hypothetical protein
MGVIVVEGMEYPNQLSNSGENYQHVKELMRSAVNIELAWISTLRKLGPQKEKWSERIRTMAHYQGLPNKRKLQAGESLLQPSNRASPTVSSFVRVRTS